MGRRKSLSDDQLAAFWTQVGHSLNLITELPQYVDDEQLPVALRVTSIDAFSIHARSLTEFLLGTSDHAVRSTAYFDGWCPSKEDNEQLRVLIGDVSEQVAHLSPGRVLAGRPVVTMTGEALAFQATQIVQVAERLARHLERSNGDQAAIAAPIIEDARTRLNHTQQVLHDQQKNA